MLKTLKRISTGINTLDNILNGGVPEGSTVLVVGRPGSGKTIMAHQMMFNNASPDSKAIYLTTLAEPQVKVMRFQQEFTYFDSNKFQKSVIYHDLGSILRKSGPTHALAVIDQLLQQHQPSLIIIDTIKTLADMITSFTEFREFLLDLSLRLATWGCTAILIGEYSEEEIELRPESSIADGIVYLYGTEDKKQQKRFLRILKMRGTDFQGGENIFCITRNGLEVYPRLSPNLIEQNYQQFNQRLSTGITTMDEMMGGGIPKGSTTLLSGASGTGKTVLALNFLRAGLENSEPALYVSFEENDRQLLKGAENLGMNFNSYINKGVFKILHVSPIELDVDKHVYEIQRIVKENNVKRLVIDSISSFEIGMHDKVKYSDYIWALTDYFKSQGVSVLLTHELHDSANVTTLTKHGISFVTDNMILLRYAEEGLYVRRYLRIVKMRSSNHSTVMREIIISADGFNFVL
ncbi:MAG: circadian clock protein KaiC [Firmicutes bacterium]|nr:circadian clock protein KaiC [Bacillota bacterium]